MDLNTGRIIRITIGLAGAIASVAGAWFKNKACKPRKRKKMGNWSTWFRTDMGSGGATSAFGIAQGIDNVLLQ